eukprot:767903-Hanusia_phi.AAC.17
MRTKGQHVVELEIFFPSLTLSHVKADQHLEQDFFSLRLLQRPSLAQFAQKRSKAFEKGVDRILAVVE